MIVASVAGLGCAPTAPSDAPALQIGGYRKLAVIVSAKGTAAPMRAIEDIFLRGLLRKRYVLAARSDAKAVLAEIGFQYSDLTERELARFGKLLNVQAVLIVSVTNYKSSANAGVSASLGARLISVERAEVLWADRASTSDGASSEQLLRNLLLLPVRIVLGILEKPDTSGGVRTVETLAEELVRKVPASQ